MAENKKLSLNATSKSTSDVVTASRLAIEAETTSHIATLLREAVAFEHGEGVLKDIAKAMALYCEAARMGDAEAQYALGWIYANGRGVPRDDERAAVFFALAAAQGHPHAQRAQTFAGHAVGRLPDCMFIDRAGAPGANGVFDFSALESLNPGKKRMIELVRKLAPEYSIHPQLALAVIAVESNFNPHARSPKNAQGLMQLIPATAQRFKVKDILDPTQNIRGGLSYLRWLLSYYRGRVDLAVAAYNAGEGAVDRYRGVPPYRETQEYLKRVRHFYGGIDHPFDDALTEPSPVVQLM
ncbi:MAG TPA: transglycosylase SLT domain-containing protein [Burkholderiales bacterium]|nr:transglycosylase SLT domain-containing protein [Burkholderiales bacterium]